MLNRGMPIAMTDIRVSKAAARAARKASKRANKSTGPSAAPLNPWNENQHKYINALNMGRNVFAVGPAGTGKTYIAARIAARKLVLGLTRKIVLARVAIADKRHDIGFLPGKADQKMAPWLVPIFDGLRVELGTAALERMKLDNRIEIVPFQHIRGRSLSYCFLILDEAQNANMKDFKSFLTRPGENCQVAVAGDPSQTDIADSGLMDVLSMVPDHRIPMEIVCFTEDDVVRSQLAKAWVKAFGAWEKDHSATRADN